MICVRLDGGLGNQLFQYAAGRALALRHGTDLLVDTSVLGRRSRRLTPRSFELNHFRCAARAAAANEVHGSRWLHRVPAPLRRLSPWHIHVEADRSFDMAFRDLPDGTYLVGYWQSFRYFEEIGPRIAGELEPVEELSRQSSETAERIEARNAVAVHVRRGDYVTLPTAARMHGALPPSYYEAAFAHVRERVAAPRFFVFSDDPVWCRANLPVAADESVFVDHNPGPDAWQDLMLMARCRHHVIANSSFSWWGAWLADQRQPVADRVVIAPERWFAGQPTRKDDDRFPSHWVRRG
jgi:hypothetical protein